MRARATNIQAQVLPGTLLIDEPREFVALGCAPGTTLQIAARLESPELTARSSAVLVAQPDSTVDVGKHASVGGNVTRVLTGDLFASTDELA
jgi:hypothetical protein